MARSQFDPKKHRRRSIRLVEYDYAKPGAAYFVTIVAWRRECLFGDVVREEMILNKVGQIVQLEWNELPRRLQYIELGAYVVMPNHFHGILIFHDHVGATRPESNKAHSSNKPLLKGITDDIEGSPLPHGPLPSSLGATMAQFKSRVMKRLWKIPSLRGQPIWQRNYYEHIIRNDKDLQNKTDYINANPLLWAQDDENPLTFKL